MYWMQWKELLESNSSEYLLILMIRLLRYKDQLELS